MKIKCTIIILQLILVSILISGCNKNDSVPTGNDQETVPVISSITSDKTQILYGGSDNTVITCNAKGGNLKYVWQVDLGDLIPLNSEHSIVNFTGGACCVGDKTITCTVSNNLGSVSKSIVINIFEVSKEPEIINIESDKTEIQSSTGEMANIVCYAIGGNLKYTWETDCGEIVVNKTDNSKIVYTARDSCIGVKTITCTVTNDKGKYSSTFKITVK